MNIRYIHLKETSSTNDHARTLPVPATDEICVVRADHQTRGRGATGGWESEDGENLLFSIVLSPLFLEANGQFLLSVITSLALYDALANLIDDIRIKWPNDIYAGEDKLAGMLVENDLEGTHIRRSVIGVGLNVNQLRFRSDAPNPVSIRKLTGRKLSPEQLLREEVIPRFTHYYLYAREGKDRSEQRAAQLHARYEELLFRKDGRSHPFADSRGTFRAVIQQVLPDGRIRLQTPERAVADSVYAFKELKFILHS